jgi:carbon-monoxide dehydrogenase medium subunit
MHPVQYHRPARLEDALAIFQGGDDASYLSGGHTLLPTMKLGLARPSDLVDLGAIAALRGIEGGERGISIGATTCHGEVAASALVSRQIPALAGLAGSIGDRHVRQRGTIGGSVANNDPAADYPAAVLGLGATVVTNRRQIRADDFFVSLYQTALEPGEIITRIDFPVPLTASYAKFRSPASRFAITAVFVARTEQGVRVAVTGAGDGGVFRARELETALAADFRPEALAGLRIDPSALLGDLNGSPEYRANLVMVMARRAMENPGCTKSYK